MVDKSIWIWNTKDTTKQIDSARTVDSAHVIDSARTTDGTHTVAFDAALENGKPVKEEAVDAEIEALFEPRKVALRNLNRIWSGNQ